VDLSREADSVKPYLIYMTQGGSIAFLKIKVPSLTELIEDFNTFFVSVNPELGTNR